MEQRLQIFTVQIVIKINLIKIENKVLRAILSGCNFQFGRNHTSINNEILKF